MSLFLTVFFSIYGAMHCYLLWKFCAAFPGAGALRWALAGALLLMVLAPAGVQMLDRWRYGRLASALGSVTYAWMAAIFWFCVLALATDVWNVVVRLAALAAPAARAVLVRPRALLAAATVIITGAMIAGMIEARAIRLRRVEIVVPRLPAGRQMITIAQISDLHLGLHTGSGRLARAVAIIEKARPDLLVSTGDLVDSPLEQMRPLAEMLRPLQPPLGKFAVLGNHEFYAGLAEGLAFHREAGFRLLRGQNVELLPGLCLAGVDDPAGQRMGGEGRTDEAAALPANRELVTILLKHQPVVARESLGRFDLQLSGHTHGGQVFPFHAITRMTYPLASGLHELPGGARLYISRGTGTWGPPLRLLAPPEVALIVLRTPEAVAATHQGPQGP